MTQQIEIVSVSGGKFHRPVNTLFDGGSSDLRNARPMRCGRSLVPHNFFETVADADSYTGGRLAGRICQQCEARISHVWRVPATTTKTANEWSGSCDPCDPANYWIDDATGERVNAITNKRTAHECPGLNGDGSVKEKRL